MLAPGIGTGRWKFPRLRRSGATFPVPALEPSSAPEPSWIAGAFLAAAGAPPMLLPVPAGRVGQEENPDPGVQWVVTPPPPPAGTPAPPWLPPASQFLFLFAYWAPSLPCYTRLIRQLPVVPAAFPLGSAMPKSPEHPPPNSMQPPQCPPRASQQRQWENTRAAFGKHGSPPALPDRQPTSLIQPHQLRDGRAGGDQGTPREGVRPPLPFQGPAAMADSHGWWKLTFLRKRQSAPKVLYENPDSHAAAAGESQEGPGEEGPPGFAARLEKIVDKSSKGKHVKVSNSGRFKEKKKVRATLAENPNLRAAGEREEK